MPSDLQVSNIKANDGTAGISIADSTGRVAFTETNPTITLGSNTTFGSGVSLANATFPAGHIVSFGQDTEVRTSSYTVGTGGVDYTDLSCVINCSSTSNKLVVQCFIPGTYNDASATRSLHIGLRSSVAGGGGASVFGGRPSITGYHLYLNHSVALLDCAYIQVVANVPGTGNVTIFPRLQASGGDFIIFGNAGGMSGSDYLYEAASIIAYEIKQ